MTLADRAQGLESLGFTERQARFLAVVALHGGYCLRRQYVAFSNVAYGKNVRDFLDSLVEQQFAQRFSLRADRGHIYHVCSRTIYRAIRDEDNRNRREASGAQIARKIMLLDFVLNHGDVEWLGTEADKVELFVDRFGVSRSILPQRVYASITSDADATIRFFPHKLPLAITSDPPVCHLVYLSAEPGPANFEAFLGAHGDLLRQLSSWTVIAIAPPNLAPSLVACERAFERFIGGQTNFLARRADELVEYFRLRRTVDSGSLAQLSVADINQFRSLKDRFRAAEVERLYQEWVRQGDKALDTLRKTAAGSHRSVGRLLTETLPFDYSQFGSLPGVA